MAKKDKVYKIQRGDRCGFLRPWLLAGSLLCIAAAFVLAYLWQYGPHAAVLADTQASVLSSSAASAAGGPPSQAASAPSSQESAASSAPAESGSSSAPAQAMVVPHPNMGTAAGSTNAAAASASESSSEMPTSSGEPLVVGGHAPAVSSAQEVDGSRKDFSVSYQVKTSEAVADSYFDDALFVGDSITTGIEIYGMMSGATVVASTGINPSTILTKPAIRDKEGNLHTILETMSQYQPKKIYVLLGANGIGWIDQERFIDYYVQLIDSIEKQHPDALLYVQSIFPVTAQKSLGENGIYSNERIDSYNAALMELCQKRGLPYLNVAEALRGPDGALPAEASGDGIHIIPDYYRRWFDYLKTHTVEPDFGGNKKPKDSASSKQKG